VKFVFCFAKVAAQHLGGHSGGQVGSSQQSATLAAGETGFAAVGIVFAMPMPRTDSRIARAKSALYFLMPLSLDKG
jgi:hypothetical protein